MFTFTLLHSKT